MLTNSSLITQGHIDQPDNTGMGLTMQHRERAKIFIQCDQFPFFLGGKRENFSNAWIYWPITSLNNVIARSCQVGAKRAGDARVEQKFHAAKSSDKGSIRS